MISELDLELILTKFVICWIYCFSRYWTTH